MPFVNKLSETDASISEFGTRLSHFCRTKKGQQEPQRAASEGVSKSRKRCDDRDLRTRRSGGRWAPAPRPAFRVTGMWRGATNTKVSTWAAFVRHTEGRKGHLPSQIRPESSDWELTRDTLPILTSRPCKPLPPPAKSAQHQPSSGVTDPTVLSSTTAADTGSAG